MVITLFDLVMKLLRSYLVESAARKADLAMSSHVFAHALQLRSRQPPGIGQGVGERGPRLRVGTRAPARPQR